MMRCDLGWANKEADSMSIKTSLLTLVLAAPWALGCHGANTAKPSGAEQAERGEAGEHEEHEEQGEEHEGHESAAQEAREGLARAVEASKVPLVVGLQASEARGQPISAKFEVEDGKLQLSVYTMKDGKFSEVVVDHDSGTVVSSEAIHGGEDLEAAQAQSAAMAKARSTLRAATEAALAQNPGYQAAGAVATVKDGHPVADVALVKGEDWKIVSTRLD
jgi:hypothetical protein